jgi:hypothetical protein
MKHHRYRVTLEYISDPEGNPQQGKSLIFEASSHDEIIGIVEFVRKSELLDTETTTALIVGQKLFGEVVLENRTNPMFSEFWPHFLEFMKKFKSLVKK